MYNSVSTKGRYPTPTYNGLHLLTRRNLLVSVLMTLEGSTSRRDCPVVVWLLVRLRRHILYTVVLQGGTFRVVSVLTIFVSILLSLLAVTLGPLAGYIVFWLLGVVIRARRFPSVSIVLHRMVKAVVNLW